MDEEIIETTDTGNFAGENHSLLGTVAAVPGPGQLLFCLALSKCRSRRVTLRTGFFDFASVRVSILHLNTEEDLGDRTTLTHIYPTNYQYLPIFTHIYPYLPIFTHIYPYLPIFTPQNGCVPTIPGA